MLHRALHLLLSLATLISVTLSTGWSLALAQTTCPADKECVSDALVVQCVEDAKQIDGVRTRLRNCQRDLDAEAGRARELRQLLRHEVEQRDRAEQQLVELKKRPTWLRVSIFVGAAILAGYGAGRVHQAVK